MNLRDTLQHAIEALEINRVMAADADGNYTREVTPSAIVTAIANLKAAQERLTPVCYASINKQGDVTSTIKQRDGWRTVALYALD